MKVLFEGEEYDGFSADYSCSHADILRDNASESAYVTLCRGDDFFDVGACRVTMTEDSYKIRRRTPCMA